MLKNLDFANKTGTYSLAVLAKYHNIPFYCAAPSSIFDPVCPDGSLIPIENRDADEIRRCGLKLIAPFDSPVYNSVFEVSPHTLIEGILSEKGIISPSEQDF